MPPIAEIDPPLAGERFHRVLRDDGVLAFASAVGHGVRWQASAACVRVWRPRQQFGRLNTLQLLFRLPRTACRRCGVRPATSIHRSSMRARSLPTLTAFGFGRRRRHYQGSTCGSMRRSPHRVGQLARFHDEFPESTVLKLFLDSGSVPRTACTVLPTQDFCTRSSVISSLVASSRWFRILVKRRDGHRRALLELPPRRHVHRASPRAPLFRALREGSTRRRGHRPGRFRMST